jgi:hypothetical protein
VSACVHVSTSTTKRIALPVAISVCDHAEQATSLVLGEYFEAMSSRVRYQPEVVGALSHRPRCEPIPFSVSSRQQLDASRRMW